MTQDTVSCTVIKTFLPFPTKGENTSSLGQGAWCQRITQTEWLVSVEHLFGSAFVGLVQPNLVDTPPCHQPSRAEDRPGISLGSCPYEAQSPEKAALVPPKSQNHNAQREQKSLECLHFPHSIVRPKDPLRSESSLILTCYKIVNKVLVVIVPLPQRFLLSPLHIFSGSF